MKNYLFIWLVILSFVPVSLSAQKFRLTDSTARFVVVPFQLCNNLIIIKLTINGSDSLNFIFDTGVRRTILVDSTDVNMRMLKNRTPIELKGLGNKYEIDAYLSTQNQIGIQNLTGSRQWVCVVTTSLPFLTQKIGMRIHGLIGYDLLKHFVTEIDFKKQQLVFYRPEKFKSRKVRHSTILPLELDDEKPIVNIAVKTGGKVHQLRTLVDTGLNDALWLFTCNTNELDCPQPNFFTVLGGGLNGDITGNMAKLDSVMVGNYTLRKVVAGFPDSSTLDDISLLRNRQASIGNDLLRRFKVYLNYPQQYIALVSNNSYYEPFQYNRSGLEVLAPYAGLPIYEVSWVRIDSPADKAGVMPGDLIQSVNNKKTVYFKIDEIVGMINPGKAKRVRLKVLRNGIEMQLCMRVKGELD
jgi:hypothetical protein